MNVSRERKLRRRIALKNRLAQAALLSYWTTVERNLALLMNHIEAIGTDAAIPTREAWRKMLFSAACEAYRIACGQETPRQLRAFAIGWRKLTTIRMKLKRISKKPRRRMYEPAS